MARRPQTPSGGPDLTALLATEQRLEQTLAAARAEGEQLVAAARARAAQVDADADAGLAAAAAAVTVEIEAAAAARIAAIDADADRELAGWQALAGPALAPVVARVLTGLRARLEEVG